jgi:phage tail-like protein
MALLSQTAIRNDPVLGQNFVISLIDSSSTLSIAKTAAMSAILDVALGGFSECSGLEMSLEIEEYKAGGANGAVHKFPSRVTWSNITLKKGVTASNALWDWHYSFVEGKGKRRDGVIALLTDLRIPHNIWYFNKGLPVKYTGPTMNAAQSAVAIESIEIAHEGIYQLPFVGLGATAATNTGELLT